MSLLVVSGAVFVLATILAIMVAPRRADYRPVAWFRGAATVAK